MFKNQQQKDEYVKRLQELKVYLENRQIVTDQRAMEIAKKAHPRIDWLSLTDQQKNYYWRQARSLIFWEERQSRLNK